MPRFCMWHVAETTLENPCTAEALAKGQFYHAYPLDEHSYVHCDQSGFPHIRPCPASLVWSSDYLTCVRQTTPTTTTSLPPGNDDDDDWWRYVMAGLQQQQQQQGQGSDQQGGGMASWQTAGGDQKPSTHDSGSSMNNMQPWMMMVRPISLRTRMHAPIRSMQRT